MEALPAKSFRHEDIGLFQKKMGEQNDIYFNDHQTNSQPQWTILWQIGQVVDLVRMSGRLTIYNFWMDESVDSAKTKTMKRQNREVSSCIAGQKKSLYACFLFEPILPVKWFGWGVALCSLSEQAETRRKISLHCWWLQYSRFCSWLLERVFRNIIGLLVFFLTRFLTCPKALTQNTAFFTSKRVCFDIKKQQNYWEGEEQQNLAEWGQIKLGRHVDRFCSPRDIQSCRAPHVLLPCSVSAMNLAK